MLAKFAQLKVNLVIVFIGAPLIIALIKLTSVLLPAKYYFSFSKLVAGSSEPFIVDPPGVTGRRLCEVLKKHSIPPEVFPRPISCSEDFDTSITSAELDQIYSIALRTDPAVRKAFVDAARFVSINQLSDAEVRQITGTNATVRGAFDAIYNHYAGQLFRLAAGPSEAIGTLYQELEGKGAQDGDQFTSPKGALDPRLADRMVQAHQSIRAELTGPALAQRIPPIKKSSLDEIVLRLRSVNGISASVAGHYSEGLAAVLRGSLTRGFARLGVAPDTDAERKLIFAEINSFSWQNYVLSVVLRMTPVFLFGLVAGFIVGRGELLSIALAGGLCAFLLSWPLMLMWDRLVQSTWADKRNLFFAFYAVYIVAFFLTARAAGVLGAWLREQRMPSVAAEGAGEPGLRLTWRAVAANLAGAFVINAAVYAWNVYIPLSGSVPR